jgi:hypothetical protein
MSFSRTTFVSGVLATLILAASACAPDRNDITAINKEYTGPYEIIARTTQPDGTLVLRVKVANLSKTDVIARNLAHQLANVAQHGLVIEILGPQDAQNAAPRQALRWPADINYRAS